MLGLKGNYFLRLKFGDVVIPTNPSIMNEFTIIQDSNKFLPSFRIDLMDTGGLLTHLMPSDRRVNDIRVEIGYTGEEKPLNSFDFTGVRRLPEGNTAQSARYVVEGLLSTVNQLIAPDYCRAFTENISTTLEDIALDDLKIDAVEISSYLNYPKLLIQAHWSIAQLFNDLKEKLEGKNGESGFRIFIKRSENKTVLVVKTLEELLTSKISYKFIVDSEAQGEYIPVFEYSIFDNYKLYGLFGAKKQSYGYFDYENTEYKILEKDCQNTLSLTKYFLIDGNDSEDSDRIVATGETNGFTSTFNGLVGNSYQNRLIGLLKMWILVPGAPSIVPGQTVQILFGQTADTMLSMQYSGYWLVEKVVHTFGDSFKTRLLLTRNGIDTDQNTTLVAATKTKKS